MIQRKRVIKVPRNCEFCKGGRYPKYGDVAVLSKYVSERGRILGRDKTGVCARHQRKLTEAIKRTRHLALMPFVSGL